MTFDEWGSSNYQTIKRRFDSPSIKYRLQAFIQQLMVGKITYMPQSLLNATLPHDQDEATNRQFCEPAERNGFLRCLIVEILCHYAFIKHRVLKLYDIL